MSVRRRADTGRWQARYRDPSGKERARDFDTKAEATQWKADQQRAVRRLDWTDPEAAKVTVGEIWPQWRESRSLKAKTLSDYDSLWASCVAPTWAGTRLDRITPLAVQTWITGLAGRNGAPLSASRKVQAHGLLAKVLDVAVIDGRIPRNPARVGLVSGRSGYLPTVGRHSQARPLTHAEVDALAAACEPHGELILVLAYCGLRWGEAVALQVRDLDLLRGRVLVRRSVAEVRGSLVYGDTKTHQAREVVLPPFLRVRLSSVIENRGAGDLVFTSARGEALRNGNFRSRVFDRGLVAAGLPKMRIHDLRHTAAALAVDSGANVKGVQRMLGHKDAAMTLNVYADLFDGHLDEVADRLEASRFQALSDSDRTEPARVARIGG